MLIDKSGSHQSVLFALYAGFKLVEFLSRINGVHISCGVNPMYPGGLARPECAPVLCEWVLHPFNSSAFASGVTVRFIQFDNRKQIICIIWGIQDVLQVIELKLIMWDAAAVSAIQLFCVILLTVLRLVSTSRLSGVSCS
ncbi:hypothetical protein GALMADRAFT_144534 [Galerina marginata CBS 339.88]|uniref:Uncharacterized protein n=1 Tax=Galerina marginata (strain CBS 339.88) TaxID=685588 RepID=A0A067SI60_GALM3|nr:hypothetical protein GALMADRAFT_144534 [Galerina marginata CBS 339.88]